MIHVVGMQIMYARPLGSWTPTGSTLKSGSATCAVPSDSPTASSPVPLTGEQLGHKASHMVGCRVLHCHASSVLKPS